ncbi:hypothetical protein A9Q81_01360 [Gammaproteobacteria bacterium 42_54_T18]|nr:hypothetical protein A9Q81_01360 [Gammaproteobacteria bacterium 42_54_T18]
MNTYKLPVVKTFTEALALPLKHTRALCKVGMPLVVTYALLLGFVELLGSELFYKAEGFSWEDILGWKLGVMVVLGLMFFISFIVAIVGCHRTFLLDSKVATNTNLFGCDRVA